MKQKGEIDRADYTRTRVHVGVNSHVDMYRRHSGNRHFILTTSSSQFISDRILSLSLVDPLYIYLLARAGQLLCRALSAALVRSSRPWQRMRMRFHRDLEGASL